AGFATDQVRAENQSENRQGAGPCRTSLSACPRRRGDRVRRREFILFWGGVAAAWPIAVQAQQRVPTIGYISSRSIQADAPLVAAARRGLREIGYVEGQNVAIEFRWGEGDYARQEALTADLVRRQVDVIVATSAPTAIAAKKVPRGPIPLVFTSG